MFDNDPCENGQKKCTPSSVRRTFLCRSDIGEWPSSPVPYIIWSVIEPKGVGGHNWAGAQD